jgi:hypothetical protein
LGSVRSHKAENDQIWFILVFFFAMKVQKQHNKVQEIQALERGTLLTLLFLLKRQDKGTHVLEALYMGLFTCALPNFGDTFLKTTWGSAEK